MCLPCHLLSTMLCQGTQISSVFLFTPAERKYRVTSLVIAERKRDGLGQPSESVVNVSVSRSFSHTRPDHSPHFGTCPSCSVILPAVPKEVGQHKTQAATLPSHLSITSQACLRSLRGNLRDWFWIWRVFIVLCCQCRWWADCMSHIGRDGTEGQREREFNSDHMIFFCIDHCA